MKSKKYIVQLFAFNIFRFSLYALVTVIALYIVFATPAGIKKALIEANAYERFVPATIEAAVKTNQNSGSAPIKDPSIQQIIKDSFAPASLKFETEKVIDNMYAWLEGHIAKPNFEVDLSPMIEQMAAKLSAYGVNRLKAQSVCTTYEPSVDPFTSTCRPRNFDYAAEEASLKAEILKNNGILEKTNITTDDLPVSPDGKSFVQQYSYAPRAFKIMRYSPLILFAITFASAIIVIYLDRKKHDAIHSVGTNIIVANVFLVLSPIIYFYILPYFFPSLGTGSMSDGSSAVLSDVINRLSTDFSNWLIIVGVIMMFIGVVIILLDRMTRPKSKYVRADKKAGLATSEAMRSKRDKLSLSSANVPLQTSEGKRSVSKYQKNKKYRKIPKKEF